MDNPDVSGGGIDKDGKMFKKSTKDSERSEKCLGSLSKT